MKKQKNKLIGTTLLFSYISKGKLEGEKRDYIFSYSNYYDLMQEIEKVVQKRVKRYFKDNCVYHGVYDLFNVFGPISEGAILGYEIWRSKKTKRSAVGLLNRPNTFVLNRFKKPKNTDYLVQAIYFINERNMNTKYTVKINLKFDGKKTNKELMKKIDSYLSSRYCLKKVVDSLKSKVVSLEDVMFMGLSDILYSPEKINVGSCFASFYKSFNSMPQINKLRMSNSEIKKRINRNK